MIIELYSVFKPLLMVFASIIIPVVGIILFFGCCAVAVKTAKLLYAAVKNRSWNVKNGLKQKFQSLAEKIGAAGGERIAASIKDFTDSVNQNLYVKFEDLRPKMVGKWFDNDYNCIGIFEVGGVYILHIFTYEKDDELCGASLILRAAIFKGPNQNVLTTGGIQVLDLAYSIEHDTIFIADFGTIFYRMDEQDEKEFGLRNRNGVPIDFDDVQYGHKKTTVEASSIETPVRNEETNIPQEMLDKIFARTSEASLDDSEESINRNILE